MMAVTRVQSFKYTQNVQVLLVQWGVPIFLFFGTQAIYLVTLHRGVPPWDSGELITTALVKGLAHPPGYPLYTLLGILFSYLPFGTPVARVNFLSAFFGSLTVALAYLTCLELSEEIMPSVLASMMLAAGIIFWHFSIIAEVFTLHSALVFSSILFALMYRRRRDRWLIWGIAFLFGLGMSHLHTIILIAPPLLWLITCQRPIPQSFRFWIGSIVFFGLGLLPYLYLPWAAHHNSPTNQINPATWPAFLDVFFRRAEGTLALSRYATGNRWINMALQCKFLGTSLMRDQKYVGIVVALLGSWRLWQQDRMVFIGLFFYLMLNLPFFLWLANAPPTPMFTQVLQKQYGGPLVVITLCTAMGFSSLFQKLCRFQHSVVIGGIMAALLPIAMLISNYRLVHQGDDMYAERTGRLVFDSATPQAVIFSCYDTMSFVLHELHDARNMRPDIILSSFNPGEIEANNIRRRFPGLNLTALEGIMFSHQLIMQAAGKRPIYFTFANKCQGQDLLGDIRDHLIPEGLVYRWVPIRTATLVDNGLANGTHLLSLAGEMHNTKISAHSDVSVQEIVEWYADAYDNLGVMLRALGRDSEAQIFHEHASAMRK